MKTFKGHTRPIWNLLFDRAGRMITASIDKTVRVWNAAGWSVQRSATWCNAAQRGAFVAVSPARLGFAVCAVCVAVPGMRARFPAQMCASPGADVRSPGADVRSPGADVDGLLAYAEGSRSIGFGSVCGPRKPGAGPAVRGC